MADSIRQSIIADIATTLSSILVVNGYKTNAGANVTVARTHWETTDTPCITVVPGVEAAHRDYGLQVNEMPLSLIMMDIFGATNPYITAEHLLGDGIKCMGTVTGLMDDVYYVGGGVETFPEDGDKSVGVKVDFSIKYFTAVGNPYSQS